jgi:hypothetical protein
MDNEKQTSAAENVSTETSATVVNEASGVTEEAPEQPGAGSEGD